LKAWVSGLASVIECLVSRTWLLVFKLPTDPALYEESNNDDLPSLAFDGYDDVLDELSNDDFCMGLERLRGSNIPNVALP
jgi:hypothetical protein